VPSPRLHRHAIDSHSVHACHHYELRASTNTTAAAACCSVLDVLACDSPTRNLHFWPPTLACTRMNPLTRYRLSPAVSESELQCPVCLLQFERKHETHELDCKHLFHTNCIIPWLKKVGGDLGVMEDFGYRRWGRGVPIALHRR